MIRRLNFLTFISLAAMLAGCGLQAPNLDEVYGTYRLNAPAGIGILTVKPDGTWEYKFDKNDKIPNAGRWTREPSADSSSTLAIVLERFHIGFLRHSDLVPVEIEQRPGFFVLNLERTWDRSVRDCLDEDNLCFIKQ
jgi:hypothetical protein